MSRRLRLVLLTAAVAAGLAAAEAPVEEGAPAGPSARYAYFEVAGFLDDALPPVYLFEEEDDTLHALLGRVRRAGRDRTVDGLIVRVGSLAAGWGKVQELRRALEDCRDGGKEVVCVLDGGGTLSYYLATACDRIVLAPAGHLMLLGLRAEVIFAKGLLDKIGVKADFVQAGKFKGAGETLTRNEPSEAFRESLEVVLSDYYDQLLDGMARGRGMERAEAEALLKDGPFTAQQAREAGLVDDVLFCDQLVAQLESRRGGGVTVLRDYGLTRRPEPLAVGSMNLFSMLMGTPPGRARTPRGPAVAVLYAVGPILPGYASELGVGERVVRAESFVKTIRQAAEDENVKAIVLRVDSPGGSAGACDRIWRELRLADAKKPVVASLSDVAASGGYYIAAGSRRIYAEPGCLTGSIGVFGGKIVLAGLLEKIGLNVAVFEYGGRTSMMSMFSEFTPEERQKTTELILDTYRLFLERVAETRPEMSADDVDKVAEGRAWTGGQAHRRGLVDELGGLSDAIRAAKEQAGIPPEQRVHIVHLPRPQSVVELLLFGDEESPELRGGDVWGRGALPEPLGRLRPYVAALTALQDEAALCLLPAVVTVR